MHRTRLVHCCFSLSSYDWWWKDERHLSAFGDPTATSVCRAVYAGVCFVRVWEGERPHGSSNPLKCCFCDRFADQLSKPRGANPCSYAPGKLVVFEADGICVLCRQTVKRVDLSWASIAPQASRWRRLLALNSLPICLTEGQAVWLFSLLSSSPILYLNSPTSPPLLHPS